MNKILIIIAFGISSVALTSCEGLFGDFLDKDPSFELREDQVFSNWANASRFHYDTYSYLRHGALRINDSWLDAASDLAQTSYATGGVRTTFNVGNYYGSAGANELITTWKSYYEGIRKCNQTLAKIDGVPKAADLTEAKYQTDKANYKAESRFLRAYYYWELFLRYGPVPIVTEVIDPSTEGISGYTTRPTIKQYVVDFILAELADCESGLMPYSDGFNAANAGKISKPMARALYSRIMLYMASDRFRSESGITWAQAAAAAKSFIDTFGPTGANNYFLTTNPSNPGLAYTNAILRTAYEGGNREVIFYRVNGTIGWSGINNDTPVGEGGNGGLCPSQNLVDMYDMKDGSSPFAAYDETGAPVYNGATAPAINGASGYSDATLWTNRDPRLAATVLYHGATWGPGIINVILGQRDNPVGNTNSTPTGYYARKYIPENILNANHTGSSYRNWIFIRYAEILLNYAEAENEANGPSAVVYNALNSVRQRSGITGSVATRTDLTSSQDNMRKFIRKERTVELAFEEHRVWDVRRWNVATKALSRDIYGVAVSSGGTVSRKVAQNRVFQDKMYLYPIPESEVWVTGLQNNPGW
jgi:starch-binding outer membrane protein, SusD/RagB family